MKKSQLARSLAKILNKAIEKDFKTKEERENYLFKKISEKLRYLRIELIIALLCCKELLPYLPPIG